MIRMFLMYEKWCKHILEIIRLHTYELSIIGFFFDIRTVTFQTKVSAMQTMMRVLITCDVSYHPHSAVTLQYVETVVRYEKFFVTEPEHIPYVLTAFLDQRGVRNSSALVRSRCSYLFSRFVKCLRQVFEMRTVLKFNF
jgi:hypothetical protein